MTVSHEIRALFITTDYPPEIGGLQAYSQRITQELPGQLIAAVIVGRTLPHQSLPLPPPGIRFASRRGRGRFPAFFWSLWSIPFFHFWHKTNYQIHMQWSTAIPSWLMKKMGIPSRYLILIHGAEILDPGRPLLGLLKKKVLESADAVVAGSRHTAEIIGQLGVECQRLEIVPYGNPLEGKDELLVALPQSFSSQKIPNPIRLLCMHRLVPRKGTHLLLEALVKLRELPWQLDIIGEGPEKDFLLTRCKHHGLERRVHFHSPVDEAQKIKILRESSLFILPSLPPLNNNHFEGLGLTLLEAQSLGLPVLAARTGGIPEAIQEGRTGMLFRAGDSEDLHVKLGNLLTNPELLKKLGAPGPNWVREHFNWETSLRTLSQIILQTKYN